MTVTALDWAGRLRWVGWVSYLAQELTNHKAMNQTQSKQKSSWQSDGALLVLALMWGTSHVITKSILSSHSPAFYTSMRFGLAAVCFALLFARHLRSSGKREIVQGILLGLCSFAGIAFYVAGLVFTQASKAGFITGLYLVFTPLLAYALFRTRPTRDHVAGLAIAIGGFVVLSFPQGTEAINLGDFLVLLAAVGWAAHIAATSAFASQSDVRALAAFQVITVATLAYLAFFLLRLLGWENSTNPLDLKFAWQIGYMAIVVTFVAALIQTWAQGRVSSTHAVIFYTLEPVTAAVFAYLVLGEKLSLLRAVGALLIVCGVLVSRLRLATKLTRPEPASDIPL
ncbi:MAG: DMT family transporter [Acidobacteria bacterium]|nr:DMT family transporter [Acidobacteriota bacterium]